MKRNIIFADQSFTLFADRSLYWPSERGLLVGDLHLGKELLLQSRGVPVPLSITTQILQRLAKRVSEVAPQKLLILGDLLHDKRSLDPHIRAEWLRVKETWPGVSVEMLLGNHDRAFKDELESLWQLKCHGDFIQLQGIYLSHEPPEEFSTTECNTPSTPFISGHVHPVIKLPHLRRALPCFVQTPSLLLMPSFGLLTGGFPVRPCNQLTVHVCIEPAEHDFLIDSNGSQIVSVGQQREIKNADVDID